MDRANDSMTRVRTMDAWRRRWLGGGWRFYLALTQFLFLTLALPIWLFAQIRHARFTDLVFWCWVITAYAAFRLAQLIFDGRMRILELTFWIYVYVWLGISPLLQVATSTYPWPERNYRPEDILATIALVIAGIFAYDLGIWFGVKGRADLRALNAREIDRRKTVLLGIAAIATSLYIVRWVGGLQAVFVSRWQWSRHLAELTGSVQAAHAMILAVFSIPPFVALLALIVLRRNSRPQGFVRQLGEWALVCLLYVVNAIANNPMAANRAWFGTVIIGIALVHMRWRRNYSMSALVFGMVLLLTVVFPYADLFRYESSLVLPDATPIAQQMVENGDYGSFQQLLNARRYVADEGISFGLQAIGALFVWVPRAIWTSKPIDSGDLVAIHAGYLYTNLDMPLWGELYIDWGVVGVIFGMLLYGFLSSVIQRAIMDNPNGHNRFGALIIPVYTGYQLLLVRGDLLSNAIWFMVVVTCMAVVTRRVRSPVGTTAHYMAR